MIGFRYQLKTKERILLHFENSAAKWRRRKGKGGGGESKENEGHKLKLGEMGVPFLLTKKITFIYHNNSHKSSVGFLLG